MKVSDVIVRIKRAGHDISDEYSTEACIGFVNHAIQQVSSMLISARFPSLIKEIPVRNGDRIPKNFMVAAGSYPICMTNGEVELLDDLEVVRFRYFATPDNLSDVAEDLPFSHEAVNEVIVRVAILLALNENEYDVSQDKGILDALQQAIASGMQ